MIKIYINEESVNFKVRELTIIFLFIELLVSLHPSREEGKQDTEHEREHGEGYLRLPPVVPQGNTPHPVLSA